MKIGIVSDSHCQGQRLSAALAELIKRGAEAIVHCGDLGDAESLKTLAHCGVAAWAVAGNTDRNVDELAAAAKRLGVTFHPRSVEIALGGGRFLVALHGHEEMLLAEMIAGRQFLYVCHGHTHQRRNEIVGPVHVINPGALHRAAPHSAALLDSASGAVSFLDIVDA